MTRLIPFLFLTFISGCLMAPSEEAPQCPFEAQKHMVQIELFFGRDISGRARVSDAEWDAFSNTILSKEFPDGLTVLNGAGQWLNPRTNSVTHESSILVLTTVDSKSDYRERIEHVVDAYKKQFDQESVGVVTENVCAQF